MARKREEIFREFWKEYRPRYEETTRKLLARIAQLEKQIAERKAREKDTAA